MFVKIVFLSSRLLMHYFSVKYGCPPSLVPPFEGDPPVDNIKTTEEVFDSLGIPKEKYYTYKEYFEWLSKFKELNYKVFEDFTIKENPIESDEPPVVPQVTGNDMSSNMEDRSSVPQNYPDTGDGGDMGDGPNYQEVNQNPLDDQDVEGIDKYIQEEVNENSLYDQDSQGTYESSESSESDVEFHSIGPEHIEDLEKLKSEILQELQRVTEHS